MKLLPVQQIYRSANKNLHYSEICQQGNLLYSVKQSCIKMRSKLTLLKLPLASNVPIYLDAAAAEYCSISVTDASSRS
jgi:hypothetical protein